MKHAQNKSPEKKMSVLKKNVSPTLILGGMHIYHYLKNNNKNLKIAQWFLDPLGKSGPDFKKNTLRITEKQKINYLNGVLDAIMRGSGILGGILSVVKNIALEIFRGDTYRSQNAILDVSPALKSKYTKARKIKLLLSILL